MLSRGPGGAAAAASVLLHQHVPVVQHSTVSHIDLAPVQLCSDQAVQQGWLVIHTADWSEESRLHMSDVNRSQQSSHIEYLLKTAY